MRISTGWHRPCDAHASPSTALLRPTVRRACQPRTISPVIDETGDHRGIGDLKAVSRRMVEGLKKDDVSGLAAEIAYRFLFAIFPFGLFVAALGAFVATSLHVDNPAQQVVAGLGDNLPPSIADALRPELERLLNSARADLLAIGAIAGL